MARHRAANAAAFVIFLVLEKPFPMDERGSASRDTAVNDLVRTQQLTALRTAAKALNAPGVPLGLAPIQSEAADAWKLGQADEITVVVYNRMAVVKKWTFGPADPLTDAAIAAIVKAADDAAGGK